jgi:hypothetical protein
MNFLEVKVKYYIFYKDNVFAGAIACKIAPLMPDYEVREVSKSEYELITSGIHAIVNPDQICYARCPIGQKMLEGV